MLDFGIAMQAPFICELNEIFTSFMHKMHKVLKWGQEPFERNYLYWHEKLDSEGVPSGWTLENNLPSNFIKEVNYRRRKKDNVTLDEARRIIKKSKSKRHSKDILNLWHDYISMRDLLSLSDLQFATTIKANGHYFKGETIPSEYKMDEY